MSENVPIVPITTSLKDGTKSLIESEDRSKSLLRRIPHVGFLLAIIEGLFGSFFGTLVKMLKDYDPFLLSLYDFLGLSILSTVILIYRKESPFPKDYRPLLIGDALFSSVAVVMTFMALKLLPLGDASVIIASTPIVILFLAGIFLKEKIDTIRLLLVLLALVGLVFISQPTFLFGHTEEQLSAFGLAAAFAALCSFSCAMIFRKKLNDVHLSVITFIYTTFAAIVVCLIVVVQRSYKCPGSAEEGLYLFGIVLSHAGCLVADITALKLEQASIVSVGRLSDVAFAFIWQTVIFRDVPRMFSIIGSILVFASIVLIGVKKVFEDNK